MEFDKIFKILTKNDTGETNSHQSGITIPKFVAESGIFPKMPIEVLNPREEVVFYDEQGLKWKFQYIYYNDVYHGKEKSKSHNEHRLTCTKDFIRQNSIKSGDSIWFSLEENGMRKIGFVRAVKEEAFLSDSKTIKLKSGWHYIKL